MSSCWLFCLGCCCGSSSSHCCTAVSLDVSRNGDITGYSVQYGEVGSGSTQTMPVSGGSATEATISGLMPSTTYSIQVAAETSAGTGPYSAPQAALTAGISIIV